MCVCARAGLHYHREEYVCGGKLFSGDAHGFGSLGDSVEEPRPESRFNVLKDEGLGRVKDQGVGLQRFDFVTLQGALRQVCEVGVPNDVHRSFPVDFEHVVKSPDLHAHALDPFFEQGWL